MNEDIERAYREGYAEGYSQGEEDTNRFDIGSGKVRPSTRLKNLDRAWAQSDARKSIAQPELLPNPAQEAT